MGFAIAFVIAFLLNVIRGSFVEHGVHRWGMHTRRFSDGAYQRHAITHHTERNSPGHFYEPSDVYLVWKSSRVPLIWVLLMPICYLEALAVASFLGRGAGWGTGLGSAIGATLYLVLYEGIHFFVHTPRDYWFQRTKLFHFWCEYHRKHHMRAKWNYNVVCPLADWCLRRFSLEEMKPEPSAPDGFTHLTGPISAFNRDAENMSS